MSGPALPHDVVADEPNHQEEEARATVRRLAGELARPFPQAAASPSARFINDLGYDSLRVLELIQKLEEEFQVPPMPPRALMTIMTVGDAEDAVLRLLAAKPRATGSQSFPG